MPIALDGETVPVYLKTDESKPEPRPAFICRYLTCRQVIAYEKALKAAVAEPEQEKQNEMLNKALGIIIVGQKNMPGDLDDLTPEEKWELAYSAPAAVQTAESDKKKLLFKSPSTSANSAPNAESKTANSDAPTAPVVTALSL